MNRRELILAKLIELNYPEHIHIHILQRLNNLLSSNSSLSYDFDKWISDGRIPITEYEGYSFDTLIQECQFNPINAFIILDWLRREPESAKLAIEDRIK